jgi:hypothetical protein
MRGVKPMVFKSEIADESVLVIVNFLVEELPTRFQANGWQLYAGWKPGTRKPARPRASHAQLP